MTGPLACPAAIGDGAGGFVIDDIVVTSPGPGEVRVRIVAAGLCHTDHAFEATGVAALAFLLLKLVRNGGNAVQLSGSHGPVSIAMPEFFWDKRYVVPLHGGCLPERDFPRLFDWAASGGLQLASVVTHTYALQGLEQAFADQLAGTSAKGVILLGEAP